MEKTRSDGERDLASARTIENSCILPFLHTETWDQYFGTDTDPSGMSVDEIPTLI